MPQDENNQTLTGVPSLGEVWAAFEETGDDGGGLLPVLSFGLEGFAAGFGEVVETGAAIIV